MKPLIPLNSNEKVILPKARSRVGSIPIMGQGYLPRLQQDTNNENGTIMSHEESSARNKKNCDLCDFVTETSQKLVEHIEK